SDTSNYSESDDDNSESECDDTSLLVTLLDLRLKKMHPWPNYIRERTIRLCREELDTIANDRPLSTASSPATTSSTN
ncbi:4225_t:CDS:2, partial [Racocetra persica]